MSVVLFDTPGPRARRRTLVWSVVAGAVLLALLVLAGLRLASNGIFDADRWDIFTEDSETLKALVKRGMGATLRAAAVAAALAFTLGPCWPWHGCPRTDGSACPRWCGSSCSEGCPSSC